jgi:hypothetical protein
VGNSFTFFIDPGYDFSQRKEIASTAIDYIKARTQSGLGVGGESFGKYSKAYTEHRDFLTAGKEGETKVNLTLTGDMLDSMEALDVCVPGRIVIGFQNGPESDKSVWMEEKGYRFLGLDASEVEKVLADFPEPSASFNDIVRIFRIG